MDSFCFVVCDAEDDESEGFVGVRQSEVVSWYLEQNEDTFETQEQLIEERQLVDNVSLIRSMT